MAGVTHGETIHECNPGWKKDGMPFNAKPGYVWSCPCGNRFRCKRESWQMMNSWIQIKSVEPKFWFHSENFSKNGTLRGKDF